MEKVAVPKHFRPSNLATKALEALGLHRRRWLILIADGNPEAAASLQHALIMLGYDTMLADTPAEALDAFKRHEVDLMILDVSAGEEALQTLQTARRMYPAVRIIASSSAILGEVLTMAQSMGADATLRKPVATEHLGDLVRRLLCAW